jgi:pimeloyl-ACP methyl ester carboxylesterase
MKKRYIALFGLLFALAAVLGAFAFRFSTLRRNLEAVDEYCRITVELQVTTGSENPKVVVLMHADLREARRYYASVVYESGSVEWICGPGEYYLAAFEDLNRDFDYQPGEPGQFYGDPTLIRLEAGEHRTDLVLELGPGATSPRPEALELLSELRSVKNLELAVGSHEIADLSHEKFDDVNGKLGMWKPNEFVVRGLHGLYFLEEYDPDRIPVVFVHGIGGTPRNFTNLIAGLDKKRYQAWTFYYPSGLDLSDLGAYLANLLRVARARFQPEKIALVAHSMGGLVARKALSEIIAGGNREHLALFMTIASPLGGMGSADLGVRWAPAVMPSWFDLSPGSPFLRDLFATPLPPEIPYHLVFSFRRGNLPGTSSDGVVPLRSQLVKQAQAQACHMLGVDANHLDVVSHPDTIEALNAALEEHVADS